MNRREKERRQVQYASSKDRAEKVGSGFGSTAIKVPKDFPLFKFEKKGVYRLSILPFIVGKGNRFADEGFVHYERTYFTHKVGMDEWHYCCLKENFHKPCPVCEFLTTLDKWGKDKDLFKALRPKQRQLFALEDQSDKGKGIQIFETHYFFGLGEFIDNKIKANSDKYGGFFHLKGGYILDVSVEQGSFEGRVNYKVKNLEMEVERKELDDETLDLVPCLDGLLVETPYKELKEIFLQGAKKGKAGEENGEEPVGLRRERDESHGPFSVGKHVLYKRKKCLVIKKLSEDEVSLEDPSGAILKGISVADLLEYKEEPPAEKVEHGFEAGDEVEFDGDTYSVKRLASDGTLVLVNADNEITRGVDPSECAKAKKAGKAKAPKAKEEEEEEDEINPRGRAPVEDDEDEEEDADQDGDGDYDEEEVEEEDTDDDEPAPKGRTSRR